MADKESVMLRTRDIGKQFSGVWVLKHIDFELVAGEIHALAGENGAGKSTFIKILSGLYTPDSGEIHLRGRQQVFEDVRASELAGIRTVHQEINLVPFFKVYQNLFIGDEMTRQVAGLRFTDERRMRAQAGEVLSVLGADISPDTSTYRLDASCQRIVQIARVLAQKPAVMIFDEPTTSLSEHERSQLLQIIVSLKKHGIGIIYISHNLDEIMKIADRVTVFRDGELIGTRPVAECSTHSVIAMMIGHKEYRTYRRSSRPDMDTVLLEARGLVNHKLRGVDLALHQGEILGVAGVVGAGKSELARALFGIDRTSAGTFSLKGRAFRPGTTFALRNGMALVPEERQAQGLIPGYSVERNISIAYLDRFNRGISVDTARERRVAEQYIDSMSIKTAGPGQFVRYLSGGNQQKVILSRWLHGDFEVGLFDEPTKGIDVKAKEDIYLLIGELADRGKGVIFFSSYLPELFNVCDRIIVLSNGRFNGEFFPKEEGTTERIVHAMLTERV